ncbi:MAG TPA: hypothetical protein VE526_01260 [Solirubrobacteraceae bacterium]|jgi:hypothetical protein|nr:hypothetical protein [Solirubrobacteraceae bacterium]
MDVTRSLPAANRAGTVGTLRHEVERLEPAEAAPPRTAPPEPAGPPQAAGAPPAVLRQLAGLPPEHRRAGIARLGGGNQQVARLIAASAPVVARVGDGNEPPTLDEILDADRRIDLKTATDEQKLAEIRRQLDSQGIFSPTAHGAWEVWLSFGERLRDMAAANPELWARQVKETPALIATSPQMKKWRDALKLDVETEVRRTLASNREYVLKEMLKLGLIGGPGGGPLAEATPEVDAATKENQKALELAAKAMEAKKLLLGIQLGAEQSMSKHGMPRIIYFRPNDKRDSPKWAEAKEKWDLVQRFTSELMSRYPVVQSIVSMYDAEGADPGNAGEAGKMAGGISTLSPEGARKIMAIALKRSLEVINNAEGLVGSDLDYRDFEPVHARLIALGAPATSGVDWSQPFEKSILQQDVRQHGIDKIAKSLGLGALSAVAFLLAEFATAGMATFFFVGVGVGIGAGQAAASWDTYADMAKMHKAGTRPEHGLISREQVDSAAFAAVLDTVFVFVDVAGAAGPLGKAAAAGRGLVAAAEAGMQSAAAAGLKEALSGPNARSALGLAVDELGVGGAAAAAGRSPDQLAALARSLDEPALASRIEAAAALTAAGTKGLDDLGTQLADVVRLRAADKLTAAAAEDIVRQSIDQFGMAATIKRAGGWKGLTKALGDESAVARQMDAWRKSLLDDLQKWTTKESDKQAQAVRTGTEGKPTNDLDINMMEIEAAGFKDRAKQFLAARAGVGTDELGKVLDAAFMVDPTRMHLQDVAKHGVSDKVRAELARGQAKVDEQVLYGRRLYDAKQAGDAAGAEKVLAEARARGIDPMEFKPLSENQRKALELQVDGMMKQLDQATEEAVKKDLIMRIHQAQAMINASTPDAYMMAGGVALNVSKRDIDAAKMPAMAPGAPGAVERYGAALDETIFLDEARRVISTAEMGAVDLAKKIADEVKNIGKHGERMAKQLADDAPKHVARKLDELAQRFARIAKDAKSGKAAARTRTAGKLRNLQREMNNRLRQLETLADKRLRQLRDKAGLGQALGKEEMEAMQDAIAFQASVSSLARQVDGYSMAILEVLEGGARAADRWPGEKQEAEAAAVP